MGGFAENVHLDFAGPAHHFIAAAGDLSFRQAGPQVQAENRLYVVFLEDSRGAQIPGAAGGLLRRLEYQQDIVCHFYFPGQPPGQLQQDRHVTVMAAGVHPPFVNRCVRQLGFFLNGQGVHVRAEGDGRGGMEVKISAKRPGHRGENVTGQIGEGVL